MLAALACHSKHVVHTVIHTMPCTMSECFILRGVGGEGTDQILLLQGQLAQLQLERDRLDKRATVAERDHAAASSELQETKLNLKVKLEEQQNQFKAIEEEQYSDWEKRVSLTHGVLNVLLWFASLTQLVCRSLCLANALDSHCLCKSL